MAYMAWHGIMYLMYYPCGGGSWMLLLMSVVQICVLCRMYRRDPPSGAMREGM